MNAYFDGYDEKYPDLIIKILEYFDISNSETTVSEKSVLKFCEKYGIKEKTGGIKYLYQPTIVDRICRKLCENNQMSCIKNIDGLGLQNSYMFNFKQPQKRVF